MTKEEKQIREAARIEAMFKPNFDLEEEQYYQSNKVNVYEAFIAGAKSDAAKEYWLQKLSEEYESKSDDSYIELIEIVNKVLKSDMAKEYHTKGMYSEKEVKKLCSKAALIHFDNNNLLEQFEKWFDQNKKK